MPRIIHVVPDPRGGWVVKRDGANRDSGHYQSRGEAQTQGRELARDLKADLVLHRIDGSEARESYPYYS